MTKTIVFRQSQRDEAVSIVPFQRVKKPRNVNDLNLLVNVLLSMDFDDCPLIEFCHTSRAKVTLSEPTSWSLDGEEALGGREVEISCLPSAVWLRAAPEDNV